jgi:hypothetical protein
MLEVNNVASLTTYGDGALRRIQFFDGARRRRNIRLANTTVERALEIKAKVEALSAAAIAGHAWKPETARWVAKLDAELYDKLADVDLVPKREAAGHKTLGAFIDGYIESRSDVKPNTRDHFKRCRDDLVGKFGAERRLDAFVPGDADEFRRHLRK